HDEIRTGANAAFSVFTPYKSAWLRKLTPFFVTAYPVEKYLAAVAPAPQAAPVPPLRELGFLPTNIGDLKLGYGESGGRQLLAEFMARIDSYGTARDFPAVKGPSYLSVHLRFGTVSIRQLARLAWERSEQLGTEKDNGAAVWLFELIWRDFYQMILREHP